MKPIVIDVDKPEQFLKLAVGSQQQVFVDVQHGMRDVLFFLVNGHSYPICFQCMVEPGSWRSNPWAVDVIEATLES